jgi:predicted enzyme related to lactoylglutathione lyase
MDSGVHGRGVRRVRWRVYFAVSDADAAVEQAAALGGTVLRPPEDTPYGCLAELADPTGATFSVMASS